MSIWVSVYCQKSLGTLKAADLEKGIKKELFYYFEDFDCDEDHQEVKASLQVKSVTFTTGGKGFHLHFQACKAPIVVDRLTRRKDVQGEIAEYLREFFQDHKGPNATKVRKHLAKVQDIFNFCLKQFHADGLGAPITYATAGWLAKKGKGLVRVDGQGWLKLDDIGLLAVLERE